MIPNQKISWPSARNHQISHDVSAVPIFRAGFHLELLRFVSAIYNDRYVLTAAFGYPFMELVHPVGSYDPFLGEELETGAVYGD